MVAAWAAQRGVMQVFLDGGAGLAATGDRGSQQDVVDFDVGDVTVTPITLRRERGDVCGTRAAERTSIDGSEQEHNTDAACAAKLVSSHVLLSTLPQLLRTTTAPAVLHKTTKV